MKVAGLSFSRLPYDDSAWRVFLRANNGDYAGVLEFYTYAASLQELGQRLYEFPRSTSDEVRFELGARDGNSAYYLLVRAFVFDRSGHTALEIAIDNRKQGHCHAEASFVIECEPASVNHLGWRLCAWVEQSDESLVWVACNA